MKLSEYPPKVEGQNYGFFGYHSALTHLIVGKDDDEAFKELLDSGAIHKNSAVLGKQSLHAYCLEYKAVKCAALVA